MTLDVECDKAVANLAVRLCDVHPDGASLRVTYGILNLTRREGVAGAEPLLPRHCYRVRIELNDAGSVIPAGHRIRLALSTSYWPMIWPAPERATVTVFAGIRRAAAAGACRCRRCDAGAARRGHGRTGTEYCAARGPVEPRSSG